MKLINTIFDLDAYLHEVFEIETFTAVDTINGIQVARSSQSSNSPIRKIAYAVDSSLETITQAVSQQVDILLVHHGIYWGKVEPLVNSIFYKVQALMKANIGLYALHLPLDAHMIYGNNVQIAKRLKLSNIQAFGNYKGISIGVQGELEHECSFQHIYDTLFFQDDYGSTTLPIITRNTIPIATSLGTYECNTTEISRIAIISGGGTREIDQAYESGVDLYITGDASHTAWLRAKELGINVIFAGHYFTEVWGVLALGTHLQNTFGIEGVFIDEPTGL